MRVVVALLGLAGLTLYGSYSYFAPGTNTPSHLADVAQIVTAPAGMVDAGSEPRPSPSRVFSPQQPLVQGPLPSQERAGETGRGVVATRRSDPFGDVPAVRAPAPGPIAGPVAAPKASATDAPAPVSTSSPAAAHRAGAAQPMTEEARVALVRDLQRELRRVGCYDGEITGWWGASSRRAMSEFTGRVNASLPVESPDYILLALVQGHSGVACGAGATRPQVAQAGGRTPASPVTDAGVLTSDASGLEQRAAAMASQLAKGPFPAKAKSDQRGSDTGSFPQAIPQPVRVMPPAAALPQPRATNDLASGTAQTGSAVPPPLPGRMAVGAAPPGVPPPAFAYPAPGIPLPEPQQRIGEVNGSAGASPMPPKAAPRRAASRDGYYTPPRSYYAERAPASSRSRSSGSLRNANNVRDFFFGAGRSSF